MKTTIKCYGPSDLSRDNPFFTFQAETPEEMFKTLDDKISWRDFPNDIWIKISCEPALLYNPMLNQFKDWNGFHFVNISKERVAHYYF